MIAQSASPPPAQSMEASTPRVEGMLGRTIRSAPAPPHASRLCYPGNLISPSFLIIKLPAAGPRTTPHQNPFPTPLSVHDSGRLKRA